MKWTFFRFSLEFSLSWELCFGQKKTGKGMKYEGISDLFMSILQEIASLLLHNSEERAKKIL